MLNIGIAWAGNPTHEQAHHRDCPLVYWLPLTEIPNIRLHALQLGEAQRQLEELACWGLIADRAPELTNMLDTARILKELDLVICVDTSLAHLAGALGVECWVLANQRGKDFRWVYGEERTAWYASWRFFWRGYDEQWGDVMRRVAGELRKLCGG
jgi:hypothetical protein